MSLMGWYSPSIDCAFVELTVAVKPKITIEVFGNCFILNPIGAAQSCLTSTDPDAVLAACLAVLRRA